MDEDMKRLPLPTGVVGAGYVRDMREVIGYDIHTDKYLVRYDWFTDDVRYTFMAEPIDWADADGVHNLFGPLTERRAECLKFRGLE